MANLLTGDNANFDATAGSWAGTACTVDRVTTPTQAGAGALRTTCSGSGAFNAFSPFFAITTGKWYIGSVYVRTAATARAFTVALHWYDAGNNFLEQHLSGLWADVTTGYTFAQVAGAAPGNATQGRLVVTFANGAASELHYIDTASVDDTPTTAGNRIDFSSPGTGSWRCPSVANDGYDVTEVIVECYAGGGGGGGGNVINGGGGGGGGGAYVRSTLTVTPGNFYNYNVGGGGAGGAGGTTGSVGGDTWFQTTGTVFAQGGRAGVGNGGSGAGGSTAASIGTTEFAGGAGGAGSGTEGGAGGGGAGTANAGGAGGDGANPGAGGSVGGGAGGNGGTAVAAGQTGTILGGGGGGGASVLNTAGGGARGELRINPTKFGSSQPVVTEHVLSLTRALSASREFDGVTEHVASQQKAITKPAFPVVTEHVASQQKVVAKQAYPVITEHATSFNRLFLASREFDVIEEHVTSSSRQLLASRAFAVTTEHVLAQQKVVVKKSFDPITEHVTLASRQLLAIRTFAVTTEHVTSQQKAVVKKAFNPVTEHVTALNRQVLYSRIFDTTTEHATALSKIVQYVRTFNVTTEHVLQARIELDFDDLPVVDNAPTIVRRIVVAAFDD